MRVGDLVKLLQEYNQDEDVVATWEGVFRYIKTSSIYLAANGKVMIDADDNLYKKKIQKGNHHIP